MAADFKMELPPGVGVETACIIAYEDDQPSELVLAGTADEEVKYLRLPRDASTLLVQALGYAVRRGEEITDAEGSE